MDDQQSSAGAAIDMVQATDHRHGDDRPQFGRLDGTRLWRVACQRLVSPGRVIVVVDETPQQPQQVPLVEHDQVVEQAAAEGAE
jgi:hypothetical protein